MVSLYAGHIVYFRLSPVSKGRAAREPFRPHKKSSRILHCPGALDFLALCTLASTSEASHLTSRYEGVIRRNRHPPYLFPVHGAFRASILLLFFDFSSDEVVYDLLYLIPYLLRHCLIERRDTLDAFGDT